MKNDSPLLWLLAAGLIWWGITKDKSRPVPPPTAPVVRPTPAPPTPAPPVVPTPKPPPRP